MSSHLREGAATVVGLASSESRGVSSLKYRAFISYSHSDNRAPNAWADWLHEAVENFKVPPEIAGKKDRHGDEVPARLFPVFQDEKELPSTGDLGEAIRDSLAQSSHLIVICSPAAAASAYV